MSNTGENINNTNSINRINNTNNTSIDNIVEEIDNFITDISNININLELDENIISSSSSADFDFNNIQQSQQSNINPRIKSNYKKFNNTKSKKYKNTKKEQSYLKMPRNNTIYNLLKYFKKDLQVSKKDSRKISNSIYMAFKRKNGENAEPDRVLQLEGERIYTVYVYPIDMKDEMKRIVIWFYNVKKLRENEHKKHLQEAKLEKLKKTDIAAYEAELERIKQESNKKTYNRNTQNKHKYKNSKNSKTIFYTPKPKIETEKINKSNNLEKNAQDSKKISKKQLDYEAYKKLQKQIQIVNKLN